MEDDNTEHEPGGVGDCWSQVTGAGVWVGVLELVVGERWIWRAVLSPSGITRMRLISQFINLCLVCKLKKKRSNNRAVFAFL